MFARSSLLKIGGLAVLALGSASAYAGGWGVRFGFYGGPRYYSCGPAVAYYAPPVYAPPVVCYDDYVPPVVYNDCSPGVVVYGGYASRFGYYGAPHRYYYGHGYNYWPARRGFWYGGHVGPRYYGGAYRSYGGRGFGGGFYYPGGHGRSFGGGFYRGR